MFLGLVGAATVAEVKVDCNDGEVVLAADENPVEERGDGVVVANTAAVEAEVALVVGGALRKDGGEGDDTRPFLKMPLSRLESKQSIQ